MEAGEYLDCARGDVTARALVILQHMYRLLTLATIQLLMAIHYCDCAAGVPRTTWMA